MINWSTDKKGAGGFGNTILYQMVAENPAHDDEDVIYGKMLIIGRTYAASVTRGAGERGDNQDTLLHHLAKDIKSVGKELTEHLDKCNAHRRVDESNLHDALAAHAFLDKHIVAGIKGWRGGNKKQAKREVRSRISFVSKYLHFHAPMAIFIFDSIAEKALTKKRVSHPRPKLWKEEWKNHNAKYTKHCLRMLEYIKREKYGDEWTPRLVDGHLLGYMNKDSHTNGLA